MKHLVSLAVAALMAIGATAQEPLMPRRCIHSIDHSLIQPVATPAGMQRAMATSTTDGLGQYGVSAKGSLKSIGSPKIPVIMVEFSDLKFHEGTTADKVTRLFNKNGYNEDNGNMRGSIRDYFVDNSNGLFAPDFEVVGKVTVANNVEYYGGNSGNSKNKNIQPLVREAIQLAQANGVDFAQYKVDGAVPMVILYYAGVGENSCFDSDAAKYIWPHFSNYVTTQGGVKFSSYFAGNEWRKNYTGLDANGYGISNGGQIDGIGVLIHELGHALGLPDLYPTNGGYYNTPDWWSVMDYGEYYANGYRPVGMTAYERSYLGWLDVQELNGEQPVELGAGDAALVRNPSNNKEYYLLENRQDGTWYPANNYGTGLLVMHVDYLANAWTGNILNNTENHLRCHVLCADNTWTGVSLGNSFQWNDLKTDLFGYGDDPVTEITDWKNYTGNMEALPVFDIEAMTDADGVKTSAMRFSYITRGLATTVSLQPQTQAEGAIYTLDGRRVAKPEHGIYIVNGKKVSY